MNQALLARKSSWNDEEDPLRGKALREIDGEIREPCGNAGARLSCCHRHCSCRTLHGKRQSACRLACLSHHTASGLVTNQTMRVSAHAT